MTSARQQPPAVLLLSPGIIKPQDTDFGLPHLVSLGSYLQHQLQVPVKIVDINYEGGDRQQLARTLSDLAPYLLIGISCYSSFDYLRVMTLGRFIKILFPAVPLVTGGYHASALAEEMIGDGSPFDAVIVGEGEAGLVAATQMILGGQRLESRIEAAPLTDLDQLPPYRWELLARYWSRATTLGRKLQLSLSRGCPHRCTFCMERVKGGRRWRAYSPERAVEELERLGRFTDLRRWIVNIADPIFGFKRHWRRQVLQEIIRRRLVARHYWTLTRVEDLMEEDVELLARAGFAIGVGLESASVRMLQLMQKTRNPERYLDGLQRLMINSQQHRLNWAANIIVGHPGEDPASLAETQRHVHRLFTQSAAVWGWLSIDPFRLYPGSQVHHAMAHYTQTYGTRFHQPRWWASWTEMAWRAEHLDPSRELTYEQRLELMHAQYLPLIDEIAHRFRGPDSDMAAVFRKSITEQQQLLSESSLRQMQQRSRRITSSIAGRTSFVPSYPIGLQVRDPWIRRREDAICRLVEKGLLHSEPLIEALLSIAPEKLLTEEHARLLLADRVILTRSVEGAPPLLLGLSTYVIAFEALGLHAGAQAVDLLATNAYVSMLLAQIVGPAGQITAVVPASRRDRWRLARKLKAHHLPAPISVVAGQATTPQGLSGLYDGLWLGAALPRVPRLLTQHLRERGRLVTFVGPRFSAQDLTCISRQGAALQEQVLARKTVPIVAGPAGWLS